MQTERNSLAIQTSHVHDLARQHAQILREASIADFWHVFAEYGSRAAGAVYGAATRAVRRAWARCTRLVGATHHFSGV